MGQPTVRDPSADVIVIGAGLAGLSAAWELTRAGLAVIVLEASDGPGGRVRTDVVDGFQLDRGFQQLNPSYPRLRRLVREGALDWDALELRPFEAGVSVALDGRHVILADPLRSPKDTIASLRAPVGSIAEKLAFAAWALRCSRSPVNRLLRAPDRPYGRTLASRGINGVLRRSVLEPFLAGVLGEDCAETSTRFLELLVRSFVRATPAVPAAGMQALPDQLAAALPVGALRLNTRVSRINGGTAFTDDGPVTARAVIVAADPLSAAALTAIARPVTRGLTTYWFSAPHSPTERALITVDGLRRGPILNCAPLSQAAPSYAPAGQALVACTVLGLPDRQTHAEVRRHARLLYPDASSWQLARVDAIGDALPAMLPPLGKHKPVQLSDSLYIAGDHRATASQQGALASGAYVARAVRDQLANGTGYDA